MGNQGGLCGTKGQGERGERKTPAGSTRNVGGRSDVADPFRSTYGSEGHPLHPRSFRVWGETTALHIKNKIKISFSYGY